MKKGIPVVFLLLLFVFPCGAYAGGFCCQMSSGVQDSAYGASMSSGNVSLRFDYTYSRMSKFVSGDREVSLADVRADPRFDQAGGKIPDTMDMQRYTLTGAYAATGRLRFVVSVPYIVNDMTMQSNMGMMGWMDPMKMHQVAGLGDISAIGLYRLYQDQEIMPRTALSAGIGLKFPTGSFRTGEGGKRVHAHMQPGTGSWDPILAVSFVKMMGSRFLLQADTTYRLATRNSLGYCYGDTLGVNAALKYNVLDFLNVGFGVNYFHSWKASDPRNSYNGQDSRRLTDYVGYTGEDSIWISPGVQVLPLKNVSVDVQFQYPVYYHVPLIEQVTDYRLTAGVSYSF